MKIQKVKLSKIMEQDFINDLITFDRVENKIFEEEIVKNDIIEQEFNSCIFKKIDFSHIKIENIDFIDCIFENCDLSNLKLSSNTMIRNQFKNSKLIGLFIDRSLLQDNIFENCNINYSTFSDSNFKRNLFKKSSLRELRLYCLKYTELFFEEDELENLEVIDTKLKDLDLSNCNISGIQAMSKDLEGLIIHSYQLLEIAPLFGIKIKEDN